MFGLFLVTAGILVAFPGVSTLECKDAGITDVKECASYVWENRQGVPITQAVYEQRFND